LYVKRTDSFREAVLLDLKQSLDSSLQPPFMVFVTQVMWCELIFEKVSNRVEFSSGRNLRPELSWIVVGALGPSLFIRDFAVGHSA
jgi:hypothetical protein